jgi:hypothetical protein
MKVTMHYQHKEKYVLKNINVPRTITSCRQYGITALLKINNFSK